MSSVELTAPYAMLRPIADVLVERKAQVATWGEQNHPDGTGSAAPQSAALADAHRQGCDAARDAGQMTWRHILLEEVYEAMAEDDPISLREELIQVAAVAAAWVEAIDRRLSDQAAVYVMAAEEREVEALARIIHREVSGVPWEDIRPDGQERRLAAARGVLAHQAGRA